MNARARATRLDLAGDRLRATVLMLV